jgi:hypothetical protein
MNFFPSEKILKSGSAEFVDAKSLRKSPLAEKIFDIGNIISIFITSDMISVTKEESADWNILKPQIMAEIMEHFSLGEEVIIPANTSENDEETIKQIVGLINARIRPALKQDGGDIDAVTAATISSRAVLRAIERAFDAFSNFNSGGNNE